MKNDFQQIIGLMRFGHLSYTGRGLNERLLDTRRYAPPVVNSIPALPSVEATAPAAVRGISQLLLLAWQMGYRI